MWCLNDIIQVTRMEGNFRSGSKPEVEVLKCVQLIYWLSQFIFDFRQFGMKIFYLMKKESDIMR